MYTDAFIREHQRDRSARLRRLAGRRRRGPRTREPTPADVPSPVPPVIVLEQLEREAAVPRRSHPFG